MAVSCERGVRMHRPNNLVESDVREALDYDPRLNDSRIIVKAENGRVTLSGAVDTFPEVELAARDARYAMGAKAIDNKRWSASSAMPSPTSTSPGRPRKPWNVTESYRPDRSRSGWQTGGSP